MLQYRWTEINVMVFLTISNSDSTIISNQNSLSYRIFIKNLVVDFFPQFQCNLCITFKGTSEILVERGYIDNFSSPFSELHHLYWTRFSKTSISQHKTMLKNSEILVLERALRLRKKLQSIEQNTSESEFFLTSLKQNIHNK